MIHIGRGSTNLGTFSEAEVRRGLAEGRFLQTDLGWKEGMLNWQPLSTFTELTEVAPLLPETEEEDNSGVTGRTQPAGEWPEERVGLPWEHREGMGDVHAFFETVKMVLLAPGTAFARMKLTGGLKEPLLYNIAGGWPSIVVAYGFQVLLVMVGADAPQFQNNPMMSSHTRALGALAAVTILGPLLLLLGAYIGAFFTHVSLTLLGGANRPFEATMRVLCFTAGSTALFQIIPVCGGLVAGIWQMVCLTIGLSRVHEISVGRALGAVFLPILVCCGAAGACAIALPALMHMQALGR